jgi:hypothetical protein
MATPHEPGTPHYPEDLDVMEAALIDEITKILPGLSLNPLHPFEDTTLRTASVEALGRQADRHEWLALLYRRLAVRRGRHLRAEAMP